MLHRVLIWLLSHGPTLRLQWHGITNHIAAYNINVSRLYKTVQWHVVAHMAYDMAYGIWQHMTYSIWHMADGIWHMTYDIWHMTWRAAKLMASRVAQHDTAWHPSQRMLHRSITRATMSSGEPRVHCKPSVALTSSPPTCAQPPY